MVDFKPISPSELKGEQKEKVQAIEHHWQKDPVVRNYHGRWKEEKAWFDGYQYYHFNKILNRLVDVSSEIEREVKNVYNRIRPTIRQQWGELRYPHSFYVEPNTTEAGDIKAAKFGSSLIEFTNLSTFRKFNPKLNIAKLWALITGNVFWKEWWNKSLWGYVEKKGGGVTKESGDLDFGFINPLNVRPDPYATSRESWRWFIEGKRLPTHIIEREFDLEFKSLPTETLDGGDPVSIGVIGLEKPSSEGTNIRIEHWEKASPGWEKGRFMVVAGGWLMWDSNSPAPDTSQLPYFQIPGILPKLDEQWYESSVRIMMEPQRMLNRYGSIIDEYIENYKLKCIIPHGLPPGEVERFTRAGVDYIKMPMGMEKPYWQNPPTPNEIIMRMMSFMETEIETESSVRKISLAQAPEHTSRTSGRLFEGMKRQDEMVLVPTVDDINTSLEDAMSYRLQLAQKHYSVPRMIKATGRNKKNAAVFLKGAQLRGNTDVRVKAGVELFSDKQAKKDVVMTFVEKNLITDVRDGLELLDVKGMEEWMEEEFVDERQADRENRAFEEGKEVDESRIEDDNHEVHHKIHNDERKKEGFASWSKKSQELLLAHDDKHKNCMQVAAAAEAPPPGPKEGEAPPVEGEAPTAPVASPEEIIESRLKEGGM